MMIDTSRHFLHVSTITHIIDSLSYDKFNVLHWHMVDAQSFPVACESNDCDLLSQGAYNPKLTYSIQDINDITMYAAQRGVRLVLEVYLSPSPPFTSFVFFLQSIPCFSSCALRSFLFCFVNI